MNEDWTPFDVLKHLIYSAASIRIVTQNSYINETRSLFMKI